MAAYSSAFRLDTANTRDLYNAACAAALAKEQKVAVKWLRSAMDKGWMNEAQFRFDSDFEGLRNTKKWKKLGVILEKKIGERHYDMALREELLAIYWDDQRYRQQLRDVETKHGRQSNEMRVLWKTINEKDSANTVKVKTILDKHGWIGPDQVGEDANQTLFLVIQHAPAATQRQYLPMMREAVAQKKAKGSSLALLEDRVALGEGKKQIYGSQVGRNRESGKYYVLPLEDPDNMDKRRAAVGLGSLADYLKNWGLTWDVEAYKKEQAQGQ